ncbi:putative aminotransferase class-III [Nostocoides australiense Ben110]|uniref:Putative aminotransferase class-III n=1 Tax=Nostocoides australiense Ben110 TaxID=1193182 RepID=W6K3P0_9MICO|nr:aminotransferase class III-fold pyridoxal phosphate-dependent enzyme [Tetrasphaera australiensis]CCH73599.1 putative aminotransferase class-III [Tetrasphaera australiensis Ben110]
MKFGFLAHPTSVGLRNHTKLVDLVGRLAEESRHGVASAWGAQPTVPFVEFSQIRSATGATCEGTIHYLPRTAEEVLGDVAGSLDAVRAGVRRLHQVGAEIVGLGGATSIIGGRGVRTAADAPVPVTSGNSLTAYAAIEALRQCLEVLDISPGSEPIAIVGYPGSIGLAVAQLLLRDGHRLALVHRETSSPDRLRSHLPADLADRATLHSGLEDVYRTSRLYVSATSSGGVIDPHALRPGSVVVDVALPRDVLSDGDRADIVVIDGGFVSAGDGVELGGAFAGLVPGNQINACVAETMLLALEHRAESFSIGRELAPEGVLEIGGIAARHGFAATPLTSFGKPVDAHRIGQVRPRHPRGSSPDLRQTTRDRFSAHVNPLMARFMESNHIDRVFTHGQGSTLTDTQGRSYLDFVAAYGALNLGHNHPRIVEAVSKHLSSGAPSLVQYVSMPVETSELAERLSDLSPVGPAVTFFSNSGAEAVEAALKVARVATGTSTVGYTTNSYHGKTLGALSVTGSARARQGVGPLVPGAHPVPFGDVAALTRLLDEHSIGAFIVEPVQGEGGVIVPPEAYLKDVSALCRSRGVVLIVDEIQTGLGRTGSMFASAREGVTPDIVCLSKSLSGGLTPIGATVCRRDLWQEAFGSTERLGLHSSTFGGNNLAAVSGLAALDATIEEDLAARAHQVGTVLRSGLREIAEHHAFIADVRGVGMMNAVEFDFSFAGALEATFAEVLRRTPGDLGRLGPLLSARLNADLSAVGQEVERTLGNLLVMRVVTKLSDEHRILTFLSANHNNVMRIQPPLVLTTEEARRFVAAFAAVCDDLADF